MSDVWICPNMVVMELFMCAFRYLLFSYQLQGPGRSLQLRAVHVTMSAGDGWLHLGLTAS